MISRSVLARDTKLKVEGIGGEKEEDDDRQQLWQVIGRTTWEREIQNSKEVIKLQSIIHYLPGHQQWRDHIMFVLMLKQDELISDLLQLQQELIRERMQSKLDSKIGQLMML